MSYLVLLDIDLTLIKSKTCPRKGSFVNDPKIQKVARTGSFKKEIVHPDGIFGIGKRWYLVYNRPHVKKFLEKLLDLKKQGKIEIGIVTAATDIYAKAVIKHLLGKDFDFSNFYSFLTRTDLIYISGNENSKNKVYFKDLKTAGKDFKPNKIIMIDDKYNVFYPGSIRQGEVVVVSAYNYPPAQKDDNALMDVLRYIKVRINKNVTKFGEFIAQEVKDLLPTLPTNNEIDKNDPYQSLRLRALTFVYMDIGVDLQDDDIFFNSMTLFDRFYSRATKIMAYMDTMEGIAIMLYSCVAMTRSFICYDRDKAEDLNKKQMDDVIEMILKKIKKFRKK